MKYRERTYYTAKKRTMMWDLYQRGESLTTIAKLFDRHHSAVAGILEKSGGIRPPERVRSPRALTSEEREEISRGIASDLSVREIARQLGRSPSTISREVNRNGGYSNYRATKADQAAWDSALRPKRCKLADNKELKKVVVKKLKPTWSPQKISGWLKKTYPNGSELQVSHETIYRTLYIQSRGALKKELQRCLRTQRVMRRSKYSSLKGQRLGKIVDAIPIAERPAEIEDRAVPGHWEGDLIEGSKNSYIATLVERHSRYLMLLKIADSKTATVIAALIRHANKLPDELYKSLTWDRGSELAAHKTFTMETNIDVYFCDPGSPWQRGTNENTNRLMRQYFPKRTDLSGYSQNKLNQVARRLNERPRKTLDYETPAERFYTCVASTG